MTTSPTGALLVTGVSENEVLNPPGLYAPDGSIRVCTDSTQKGVYAKNGAIRVAQALAPSTPTLLQSFDTDTGADSGGGVSTLDTSIKIQGTGSIQIEGSGVSGQNPIYTYTGLTTGDPALWDVIAWYEHHKGYPHASQTFWQFGRSSVWTSAQPASSQVNGNFGGGIWRAAHMSEFTGLPSAGSIDARFRITQNAPYNNRVNVDSLLINAKGIPTVLFTFDDDEDTTIDVAYPIMDPYGIKGSLFIARDMVGVSDGLTLAEIKTLYNAQWDACCDGTVGDTAMTAEASVAAAVASLTANRDYLVSNGMTRGVDHFCYPNGHFMGDSGGTIPTATQVAAVTAPGGTTLNFGAASNVLNGWTVYGKGIPLGTTVVSGGGAATNSVVVSNSISAQGPLAAAFIDESPTFYKPKLINGVKAAGFKLGRSTLGGTQYTNFGFGDQALVINGQGASGLTLNQLIAFVDEAILRGTTVIFYFHRVQSGGGINIDPVIFQGLVDYVGNKKRQNILQTLTMSQLYYRDVDGALRLP